VFAINCPFHISLTFVGKVRSLPAEWSHSALALLEKYQTKMEVARTYKHTSLYYFRLDVTKNPMDSQARVLFPAKLFKPGIMEHSSLMGQFASYEENEVLRNAHVGQTFASILEFC